MQTDAEKDFFGGQFPGKSVFAFQTAQGVPGEVLLYGQRRKTNERYYFGRRLGDKALSPDKGDIQADYACV